MLLPIEQLIPPQALEPEEACLGAALISTSAAERLCEETDLSDWYHAAHRHVFAAVRALIERREQVDLVSVAEELRRQGTLEAAGGMARLNALTEACVTAAHLKTYLEPVQDTASRRQAIEVAQRLEGGARDLSQPLSEVLEEAESGLFKAARRRGDKGGFMPISVAAVALVDELSAEPRRGVPTGFGLLDWFTGGWQRELLYLVAGRPGSGKTALLLNCCLTAAEAGVRVGFFSLEMSRSSLMGRLQALRSGVSPQKLRSRQMDQGERDRVVRAAGQIGDLPIFLNDSRELTLAQVRGWARRVIRRERLDFVLLDYAQLILPEGRGEADVKHHTRVAEGLKSIAREAGVPVLAACQLSRKVEERKPPRPLLSDLRESGGYEQAADAVLLLYRAAYYQQQEGQSVPPPHPTELILGKHRDGEVGAARVAFWPETMRFAEWETRDDAPPEACGDRRAGE